MSEKISNFLLEAIRLKRMVRSGWIYTGVPKSAVESVADHSFMVAIVSLVLALKEKEKNASINVEKVLIMALLHDLAESVTQDIDRIVQNFAPNTFDEFKKEVDTNATKYVIGNLPKEQTKYLLEIHQEFLEGKSREALIVREADRLETLLQLHQYRQVGFSKEMFSDFFKSFEQEIEDYTIDLAKELAELYYGMSNDD
jgi:putative hydrolase of HD superfamily